MNSKVSFFNFNYLKENFKKSRGIIFLFLLIVPVFTYLFMLLINNNASAMNFPSLIGFSIPAVIGMYIIPFVMAITLFNFLFKKDSVDYINALPLQRKTIFITNIIGGMGFFFVVLLITSLVILLSSFFFTNLVIPKMMCWHFFITFFISYSYTFVVSALAISLTGSRVAHVALTLIILFIPGFISDFYTSKVYGDKNNNYAYPVCDRYDKTCDNNEIYNHFIVEQSYKLENGQTLPYKYINVIPRTLFNMHGNEVTYAAETNDVYNVSSIVRMIILSVIYFMLGLYAYVNRKMEIAEATFKSEHFHQLVKCLTLLPLCLGTIAILSRDPSLIVFWIMLAIIITIYAVYDLITRRNSGKFVMSLIYFEGLILSTIIIYYAVSGIGHMESSTVIDREDVRNVGISPNNSFGYSSYNVDLDVLKFKIDDSKVIDLIFENANKKIASNATTKQIAIRLNLKNGSTYYFNLRLDEKDFDQLLLLLDKNKGYDKALKNISYNDVYGLRIGDTYLNKKESVPIVDLIKEGYQNKSVTDIVKATYLDYQNGYDVRYSLMNMLYVYNKGMKTYSVSTMINPKLVNYVIKTSNARYIKEIKNKNINIGHLNISIIFNNSNGDYNDYFQYVYDQSDQVYRYINDNVKSDIDFSKYTDDDFISFEMLDNIGNSSRSYRVFLPKDAAFEEFSKQVKDYAKEHSSNQIKGSI